MPKDYAKPPRLTASGLATAAILVSALVMAASLLVQAPAPVVHFVPIAQAPALANG